MSNPAAGPLEGLLQPLNQLRHRLIQYKKLGAYTLEDLQATSQALMQSIDAIENDPRVHFSDYDYRASMDFEGSYFGANARESNRL